MEYNHCAASELQVGIITIDQAAADLGISYRTVLRYITRDRCPHHTLVMDGHRRYLVSAGTLRAFIERQILPTARSYYKPEQVAKMERYAQGAI